jgi:hypothetical protein
LGRLSQLIAESGDVFFEINTPSGKFFWSDGKMKPTPNQYDLMTKILSILEMNYPNSNIDFLNSIFNKNKMVAAALAGLIAETLHKDRLTLISRAEEFIRKLHSI